MLITLSPGGPTMFETDAAPSEVLVGTTDGIVALRREHSSWEVTSRMLEGRHIHALLDIDDTIFAGVSHGSVMASEDRGATWQHRGTGIDHDDIYSLARTERDGDVRLYAGTEPAHLYVSDDHGSSWNELPNLRAIPHVDKWWFPTPPHLAHLKHITFDPDNEQTMYASVEQGALLESNDAGDTWQRIEGIFDDAHRLVIDPNHAARWFATTGIGLYASVDRGVSWEQRTDMAHEIGGYPDQLVLRPRDPDVMFVAAAYMHPGTWRTQSAGSRISRSRDDGRTWTVLRGGLPDRLEASIEALCIADWGTSCALFAGTTAGEVWASDDAGDTWSCIADLAPLSKGNHYRSFEPVASAS